MKSQNALLTTGATMQFVGLKALDSVDIEIPHGKITGLIGPNGSGKSTFVNVISGVLTPTAGTVHVDGEDLSGSKASVFARHGIARTFQTPRLFGNLTVRENVAAVLRSPQRNVDLEADEWLDFLEIGSFRNQVANSLAYGLQRRLEIARAFATRPRYVLLDEPAAGLNDDETASLEEIVKRAVADPDIGCGVLVIDHDMRLMVSLCETLNVLVQGKKLMSGTPSAVRHDQRVIEAYLGTKHTEQNSGDDNVGA